jgi:TonB family protein
MTSALLLRDLWMYSLQVALLVGGVAVVAAIFNDRVSRANLVFWQAVLIACLILPLCQAWRETPAEAVLVEATSKPMDARPISAGVMSEPGRTAFPWHGVALAVLGAGVVLRLLWLALGLWSLRRLRRASAPLQDDLEPFLSAQRHVGAEARFHSSQSAPSPVTFGLRHPVVLLPESVLGLDTATQNAIAYHELLHVKGRDWIQLVTEECIHALLWFHPAIWWLLDRIHLTREQVVDRAVIDLTESRQGYVNALLAVAALPAHPAVFPATLFLRKSRLRRRVNELFKETPMSRTRLLLSLGVSSIVVVSSVVIGARLFPLEARAAAPTGDDHVSIQVKGGSAQLIHTGPTEYPRMALRNRVQGAVDLELSVDEQGLVSDARVLDGPMELRAAALTSALKWHFVPSGGVLGGVSGGVAGGVSGGVAGGVQGGVAGGVTGAIASSKAVATITFSLPDNVDAIEANLAEKQRREVELQSRRLKFEETNATSQERNSMRLKFLEATKTTEMAKNEAAREALTSQRADKERLEHQLIEVRKVKEAHGEAIRAMVIGRKDDESGVRREQAERQLKERLAQAQTASTGAAESVETRRRAEEVRALVQKVRETERQRLLVPGPLVQIRSERLPDATLSELQARLSVSIGDTLDTAAMRRIVETVRHFDEHLSAKFERNEDGGLILVIVAP